MAETVIASYGLTYQCGNARPWSLRCTTSYSHLNHEPTRCKSQPPQTICVKPGRTVPHIECVSIGVDQDLPPYLVASIELHDCDCAAPPTDAFVLRAVEESGLQFGEAVRWEGEWFRWDYSDESCWGLLGVPPEAYRFYIRFAFVIVGNGEGVGAGVGCTEARIYCEILGGFPCDQPLYRQLLGYKPIVSAADVSPISLAGTLRVVSFACESGPLAGVERIAFCGWVGTEPADDGHYGVITVGEP